MCSNARLPWRAPMGSSAPLPIYQPLVNDASGAAQAPQGTKGDRHKAGYLPPRPPGGHELRCCATSVYGSAAAARGP